MASQVLSGSGNISYTNTTGKNVRFIINFMSGSINFSWGNVASLATHSTSGSFGKNVCYSRFETNSVSDLQNYVSVNSGNTRYPTITLNSSPYISKNFTGSELGLSPIEYILAPNHVFRAEGTISAYNILTITED
jgi:hypothetical protein